MFSRGEQSIQRANRASSVQQEKRIDGRGHLLTLRPPVLSFMGVRKGSKIMWLVSMLTGDCLFPTEQRFQAELTSPQKDGTATKGKIKAIF